MSTRIHNAIVFGNPDYNKTIFTESFQRRCTIEELDELYNILYGWTTMAWYNDAYKKRLRQVMKQILVIQKEKEKNKK